MCEQLAWQAGERLRETAKEDETGRWHLEARRACTLAGSLARGEATLD